MCSESMMSININNHLRILKILFSIITVLKTCSATTTDAKQQQRSATTDAKQQQQQQQRSLSSSEFWNLALAAIPFRKDRKNARVAALNRTAPCDPNHHGEHPSMMARKFFSHKR